VIDRNWREHLVALTNLREGSELGTLKGLDPLMHYRREADELSHVLIASIKEETADYLMNVVVEVTDNPVTSPD
jgi:preprotein translocase subunit SecA